MPFLNQAQVMEAVEQWCLEENSEVIKTSSGFLAIETGTQRVFFVPTLPGGTLVLQCFVQVLIGVEKNTEMAKELLLHPDYSNYYAGAWSVAKHQASDGKLFNLLYEHSLLTEHLDKSEWLSAAKLLIGVSEKHGDELQAKWGGKTWIKDRTGT